MANLFDALTLGEALEAIRALFGQYELLAHWKQGEFHHDVLVAVSDARLGGDHILLATNCNGGVKEILVLEEMPERYGLWHHRCPANPEFEGAVPRISKQIRTDHWFHPCELLAENARSELREEFRVRQRGGGWMPADQKS